jgi:23S rRNA pseudouridine1911/1915/1917 synthase
VHRLDRGTSGVLLFARDAATARTLTRQRASGVLGRDYLALVAGRPPAAGEIAFPLGPDPAKGARRHAHRPPDEDGAGAGEASDPSEPPPGFQAAHTAYRVVQYGEGAPGGVAGGVALVAVRLGTGRTHQVRAHFAAAGYPLLGDDLYGGPPWPGLTRQALHAWRIGLRHPATGESLILTAPLPADFRAAARLALL